MDVYKVNKISNIYTEISKYTFYRHPCNLLHKAGKPPGVSLHPRTQGTPNDKNLEDT